MSTANRPAAPPITPRRPRFEWNDEALYQWSIGSPRPDYLDVVFFSLGAPLLTALIFAGFWIVGLVAGAAAYWLSVVVSCFFLFMLALKLYPAWFGKPHVRQQCGTYVRGLAIGTMGCLLYALSSPHSGLAPRFKAAAPGDSWQWLVFVADNTLSIVLMDVPDFVFGFRLSPIECGDGLSRAVALVIRFLITVGTVQLVLEVVRTRLFEHRLCATVKECWTHCEGILARGGLELRCEGKVQPLVEPIRVPVDQFVADMKSTANAAAP